MSNMLTAEHYIIVFDALTVLEYAVCDWDGWLFEVSPPASAHLRTAAYHLAEAVEALTSVAVVAGITIDPAEEDCP